MATNNGHESAFSVAEVVGISAAAAAALGGIVIALGRTQANSSPSSQMIEALPSRDTVTKQAARGRVWGQDAAEAARKRYPDARDFASTKFDQTADAARVYSAEVASAAESGYGRARSQGKVLSERVQESVIPAIIEAAEKVRKNVSEQAKQTDTDELVEKSRHLADEAAQQLRQAGSTVSSTLQESVLPAVTPVAKDVSERAGDVLEQLRERADDARSRNDQMPGAKKLAAGRDSAQHAMQTSTRAAKDTMSSLLWLSLASALVYLVLLSPERREQVKSMVFDTVEQVRLLIGDFKGYETEF